MTTEQDFLRTQRGVATKSLSTKGREGEERWVYRPPFLVLIFLKLNVLYFLSSPLLKILCAGVGRPREGLV